jgi:hypothetical protein
MNSIVINMIRQKKNNFKEVCSRTTSELFVQEYQIWWQCSKLKLNSGYF